MNPEDIRSGSHRSALGCSRKNPHPPDGWDSGNSRGRGVKYSGNPGGRGLELEKVFCRGHFDRQVQNAGHRSQVTGHRSQVTGHRSQITGHRLQVTGYRSQVTENVTKS